MQAYQRAIDLGEAGLKADLLLATGRCYEGLRDVAKAKNTYEQVATQFPNTPQSKAAEAAKAQLQ